MGLETIFKLKAFLTPRNLQLLDVFLGVVTEEGTPVYKATWGRFEEFFPTLPGIGEEAANKLRDLRAIVQEYRKSG